MTTEPRHSLEVERKYDVEDRTPVVDWTRLPGVAAVGEAEHRDLDARYLDTPDGALGRALIAVRRRTGGPDEGWHIKRATPEGKLESWWPLGDADDLDLPEQIAAELSEVTTGPFVAIARIRNARVAYPLRDAAGELVAEFVDDRVTATDERTGRESTWREWEVELGPAAPADAAGVSGLFDAADQLVAEAGGRVAASESKLARALGM